jgi:hypothetical protein
MKSFWRWLTVAVFILVPLIVVGLIVSNTEIKLSLPLTPAERMEARGKTLQGLPEGNIVLYAPNAMRVGERRNVQANVSINVAMETVRKRLDSRTQTFEGWLRVSSEMDATLNGPGFKIDAFTPERQTIAEGFPTVWSWNVEAEQEGEQELEVTLYAVVGSDRQRIDSYDQKITVSVREQTWREWLDSLSHEVDTAKTILLALGGAVMAVLSWFGISLARRKKQSHR